VSASFANTLLTTGYDCSKCRKFHGFFSARRHRGRLPPSPGYGGTRWRAKGNMAQRKLLEKIKNDPSFGFCHWTFSHDWSFGFRHSSFSLSLHRLAHIDSVFQAVG